MLYIPWKIYQQILKYCEDKLPYEACGLAGGTSYRNIKYVKKVYLLTNTDVSCCHFTMDVKEQFAAIKDIRARGYQLLGNFHSHPSAPARLSYEDIRLAYDFKTSYMVLSLEDRKNPVLSAFNIDSGKNVTSEELVIEDR